jgi:hypothetical protein
VLIASTLSCVATPALADTHRNPFFESPTQKTQPTVGAVEGLRSNNDSQTESPILEIIDFDAIDRLMLKESSTPSRTTHIADQSRTQGSPQTLLFPRRLPNVRPESASTGKVSNTDVMKPNRVRRLAPVRRRNTETDSNLAVRPRLMPDVADPSASSLGLPIAVTIDRLATEIQPPATEDHAAITAEENRNAPVSLAGFRSRPTDQENGSVETRSPIKRFFDRIPNLW